MDLFERLFPIIFLVWFCVVIGVLVFIAWFAYHIARHMGWV